MNPTRTILLTGLGNTGSHLAPLIARSGVGGLLVLVDPDIVEAGNMGAQAYGPDDVGKPKAEAMAERIAGAQTVVLPNAAHMLPMEHPAEFNQLVLDFLSHLS